MKVIGKQIKWIKYALIILLICFTAVDVWLFYSLTQSKNPDRMLIIMPYVVLAITVFLLVCSILEFIKKTDVIFIKDNKVIIKIYKTKELNFEDIKDIKYCLNSGGGRLFNTTYKSGKIIFVLKDNKKIKVDNIKDVEIVCSSLRNLVLKEKQG